MKPRDRITVRLAAPCPRQAVRLAHLVDSPLTSPPTEVLEHIAACTECAEFLAGLRMQASSCAALQGGDDSVGFEPLEVRIRARHLRLASKELTALSRQLLLLEGDFEASFPPERSSTEDDGLLPTLTRIRLRWRATDLAQHARPELGLLLHTLLDAEEGHDQQLHDPEQRLLLAAGLLEESLAIDAQNAEAYLLRAQKNWVFGDSTRVPDDLDDALRACRSPRRTGVVLLHRAIWQADQGDLSAALDSLLRAIQLAPHYLAVQFTMGVYATATGSHPLARRSLQAAAGIGSPSDRIRRMLQVKRQLRSLSSLGVFPSRSVNPLARDILGTLSSLLPTDSWTQHATF